MPKSADIVLSDEFLKEAANYRRNHPLTFTGKRGLVVVPFIAGGAPEPGEGEGGTGETGEAGETGSGDAEGGGVDEEGAGDDDTGSDESAEEDGLPEAVKTVLRKNRAATRAAEKAARKAQAEAAKAMAKAKEYEDRDKSELDRANERAEAAEKALAEARANGQVLALRTAFLQNSAVSWADAEDAYDIAMNKFDLGEVEVSESGSVDKKKVAEIVKRMAKEKPHLVSTDAAAPQGKTGGAFNNKGGTAPAGDQAALAKKYPALRGRSGT